MSYRLPHLHFGHSQLEPFLSRETIDTHYFGHHKGYIDKVNKLLREQNLGNITLEYIIHNHDGELFDNGAQAWNHTFFWAGLSPEAQSPNPEGDLFRAINEKFRSVEKLKVKFNESAAKLFGSGWTWLVATPDGELDVLNTHNADNPMRLERVRPLWVCDVWEHAYYIDYRNERKEYLDGIWKHINWQFVEECFAVPHPPNMSRLMRADTQEDPTLVKV